MGVQITVRVGIETEDLWMCLFLKVGMLLFSIRCHDGQGRISEVEL